MRTNYAVWVIDPDSKEEVIDKSFKSMKEMSGSWKLFRDDKTARAKMRVEDDWVDITSKMPTSPSCGFEDLDREREFTTAEARDAKIIEEAVYFTVTSFLGVGQYDRHEMPTRKEARNLARELSKNTGRTYIVYAVNDRGYSAFVGTY